MQVPRWDEPIAAARHEAEVPLSRGLDLRPTSIAFEGDEPTLYVRGGPCWPGRQTRTTMTGELLVLLATLGLSRAMIISEGTLTDEHIADPTVREVLAQRALIVERGARATDGLITTDAHLLPYRRLDDGRVAWDDTIPQPDGGPWAAALRHFLEPGAVDAAAQLGATGLAYGLSRRGAVVAVSPTWRGRYGFDAPVDPRMVRAEDRHRARRTSQPHRTTRVDGRSA